ncbi:MAG: MBL fold metallo-hydrolase [Proteobacteria bacterium]|nr:MBL fold metallo-hydrolase [Pseudomonadota bacterium]
MAFVVTPLGVGDAFSQRFYSSCLLVEGDDYKVLIDCPHPIRKMMFEANVDVDIGDIDAVVLTHLHADHCSGLEGFAYFAHFVLQRKVRLVAHPIVVERLWQNSLAAGMGLLLGEQGQIVTTDFDDFFEFCPLDFEAPTTLGPFQIHARPTRHHIPTTALRLCLGERELGYSADTSFDVELIHWLCSADLIIHETNYGIHTPYEALAALPASTRQRMRLIHYPDDRDWSNTAIAALKQGIPLVVP